MLGRLAAREAELRRRIDRERESLVSYADGPREPGDDADIASERASASRTNDMIDRHLREIASIDVARERIRDGSFGDCLDCGEAIDPRRLEVAITAVRCADCQARFERKSTLAR